MMLVKVPKDPSIHRNGCPLWGNVKVSMYLQDFDEKRFEGLRPIPMNTISVNPIKALTKLIGIDVLSQFKYEDVYVGGPHCGVVPTILWTHDPQQYADNLLKTEHRLDVEYVLDTEWHERLKYSSIKELNPIHQAMMGSGYTISCLASDGEAKQHFGIMTLDNNDLLLVAYWQWFNK